MVEKVEMIDYIALEADVRKKMCYTCQKEGSCNPLQDDIACKYVAKPEARKILRRKKRIF